MKDEAEISISGVKLTNDESMTVRVAIDTLANVLAEGIGESGGQALADRYLNPLSTFRRFSKADRRGSNDIAQRAASRLPEGPN